MLIMEYFRKLVVCIILAQLCTWLKNFIFLLSVDYRLEASAVNHTGRIEVWRLGEWGTVCSEGFDMTAADMFCKALGFPL